MRIINKLILILFLTNVSSLSACTSKIEENGNDKSVTFQNSQDLDTAYFASGCFWCVEAVFESVIGVEEAVSGYAGGSEKNPTYRQVSAGMTSHAEAVM